MFTHYNLPIETKIGPFYATLAGCVTVAVVNFVRAWEKHSVSDALAAALFWLVIGPLVAYFTMRKKSIPR
jgi:hypothetical protein